MIYIPAPQISSNRTARRTVAVTTQHATATPICRIVGPSPATHDKGNENLVGLLGFGVGTYATFLLGCLVYVGSNVAVGE